MGGHRVQDEETAAGCNSLMLRHFPRTGGTTRQNSHSLITPPRSHFWVHAVISTNGRGARRIPPTDEYGNTATEPPTACLSIREQKPSIIGCPPKSTAGYLQLPRTLGVKKNTAQGHGYERFPNSNSLKPAASSPTIYRKRHWHL
jgi:hypothetical protein